jgi:hypothetical protein
MNLWKRWVALLSRTEPGDALALYRMAIGVVVSLTVAFVAFSGALPVIWYPASAGGLQAIPRAWGMMEWLGGSTVRNVNLVSVGVVVGGLVFALGLGGRLTALFLLQGWMSLSRLHGEALGSYDFLMSNALWIAFLSDSTRTLSLDCKLRTGSWTSDVPVTCWPRWLGIVQILMVYGSTGLQKVGPEWSPAGGFSAVFYALHDPNWLRWDMQLSGVYFFTQVGTAMTWLFELGAPLVGYLLWCQFSVEKGGRIRTRIAKWPIRQLYLLVGVGMHCGIILTMEVGPFSYIAMALYFCFLTGDEAKSLVQRARARFAAPAAAPAS